MQWLKVILYNQKIMIWIMALLVFLLTQLLKFPIKFFTNKIKKESTRKAVNSTIMLLPFALGCLVEYIYCYYILHCAFDLTAGFILGGQSMAFYGIIDHLFGIKIENELETEEGQEVLEAISDAQADGVVTTDEVKDIAGTAVKGKKNTGKTAKAEKVETPKELQEFLNGIDVK